MIKIAVYPRDAAEQRIHVFNAADLTIATSPSADIVLPVGADNKHYAVFVGEQEGTLTVTRMNHSALVMMGSKTLKLNEETTIEKSDVLILGDYRIYIRRTLPLFNESDVEQASQAFLDELRRTTSQDPLRLVFADWLDENNQPARAAYLRAQYHFANLPHDARPVTMILAATELRDLAASVDTQFRILTSIQPIENCAVQYSVLCPRRWADLHSTENEDVRHCVVCNKAVFHCNTLQEARLHVVSGDCVAIDASLVREPGDLQIERENEIFMGEIVDEDIDRLFYD